MYSTGHGDIELSPDGRELYYAHHGRPTPTDPQRRLYTDRMRFIELDALGKPGLTVEQSTSDEPVPSGVAPYRLHVSRRSLRLRAGARAPVQTWVTSADGVRLALENPLNRVAAGAADPSVATVVVQGGRATVMAGHPGRTTIRLTYQRKLASGGYRSVFNDIWGIHQLVTATLRVRVRRH